MKMTSVCKRLRENIKYNEERIERSEKEIREAELTIRHIEGSIDGVRTSTVFLRTLLGNCEEKSEGSEG